MSNLFRLRNSESSRGQQGQATIEFALSVLAVLFMIFLSWELLMAVYTANVLGDAAKEGVRYAIVHGSTSGTNCKDVTAAPCSNPPPPGASPLPSPTPAGDPFGITNVVTDFARTSGHDISGMTVTVTYLDGNNDPPNRVDVKVTYTFVPYINLPITPTFSTHAQGRIVY